VTQREACITEIGLTICSTAKERSSGITTESFTKEIFNKAKRQERASLNLTEALIKVISRTGNSTEKESITSLILAKCILVNSNRTNLKGKES